jgi:hypothetical protein
MQTIICSHGFGVKADARGMFTEIEKSFVKDRFVMFDYNTIDHEGNTVVSSIGAQANKLQSVIDKNHDGSILLCHSQGSIIAGLVDLHKISQVILLAPPVARSMADVIEKMTNRPGSAINKDGSAMLTRTDGTITYVPEDYVKSLMKKDPIELYSDIAAQRPTVIVRALEDEVVGLTDVDKVRHARIIDLKADHNFTGSRPQLISILESNISS